MKIFRKAATSSHYVGLPCENSFFISPPKQNSHHSLSRTWFLFLLLFSGQLSVWKLKCLLSTERPALCIFCFPILEQFVLKHICNIATHITTPRKIHVQVHFDYQIPHPRKHVTLPVPCSRNNITSPRQRKSCLSGDLIFSLHTVIIISIIAYFFLFLSETIIIITVIKNPQPTLTLSIHLLIPLRRQQWILI